MANIKRVVRTSFAFYFIFFVAFVVGFGLPGWVKIRNVFSGLWQACYDYNGWNCEFIEEGGSTFNAVRGLVGGGALFYLIAFFLHCAWLSKSKAYLDKNGAGSIGKAALSLQILGCVFSAAGVILYGVELRGDFDIFRHAYALWLVSSSTLAIFINATATLGTTACCFKSNSLGVSNSRQTFISNQPISNEGARQTQLTSGFEHHTSLDSNAFATPVAQSGYQPPPAGMYQQQQKQQPQPLYPPLGQQYPQNNQAPPSTNVYLPQPNVASQLSQVHLQQAGGYPNPAFDRQPSAPKLEPNSDFLY